MPDFKYKTKWEFPDFYESIDDLDIDLDIKTLTSKIKDFAKKWKGKIRDINEDDLLKYYEEDDDISKLSDKLGLYFFYLSTLDTQDQKVLKKQGEFYQLMTDLGNELVFVGQEFKELGYEKLMKLSKSKKLKAYENALKLKAINLKYLLDEKTEFALNLKNPSSGSSAFGDLYEELTNSFVFKIEIDGEVKELTDSEIRALRTDPSEDIRRKATEEMRRVYGEKNTQITLGKTYSTIVKDWTSEVKLRGYSSVMEIRNKREQLDNKTIDLMLEEVEKAYPLYQRYIKAKASLFGKDKLEYHNVFAPLSESKKEYEFEEALDIYLNLMKDFDKDFYNNAVNMFKDGRVDVMPAKGKRGGAFSMSCHGFKEYVMLNHTKKLSDVSTIAHEMGHATHGYLSQDLAEPVFHPPLSLAETASVFNEMLLSEHLIKTLSEEEKLEFLDENLTDILSTIFRQIQYILFERRCHEKILAGEELKYEDFNRIWREEQKKLSGDSIIYDVEDNKETAWSSIPHIFHTPFYCYSYAFGNLLTFALYEQYRKEGKPFIEKYKNILRAGGSRKPAELLKENGLDINSRKYYQNGLKVVEDMVKEYEELVKKT